MSSDQPTSRADVEAAKGCMATTFGGRRELRALDEYLRDDEQVLQMATGRHGKGQGLLALTDRRLVFIRTGLLSKTAEEFPLATVSAVRWVSGLLLGKIFLVTNGAEVPAEFTDVDQHDGAAVVAAIQKLIPASTGVEDSAPATGAVATQARELALLHAQGTLTDEEYQAKMRRMLGL